MSKNVLTKQSKIAELSKKFRGEPILTLNHYIDLEWAKVAFNRVRRDGAAGIDNVTAQEYALNLDKNLQKLIDRLKSGEYYAPPSRRVYIPKQDKSLRPINIPTLEDKVAQKMVQMLLEPIYEGVFYDCSFGFRPGLSCHMALRHLRNTIMNHRAEYILDVDIRKFFESVPHGKLREFVRQRVGDGVVRRLIDKWLKAGYVEKGDKYTCKVGTPAGGVVSPLLANVFLHYVIDEWFETMVKPCMEGKAFLIRFCDDFVMCFTNQRDAERVYKVLPQRLEKYSLSIHEGKTQLVDFRRLCLSKGKQDASTSFSFLGFMHVWGKSRRGYHIVKQVTAKSSLRKALKGIYIWCKRNRHEAITEQHRKLVYKIKGHYAYFGITGNHRKLSVFTNQAERIWYKWLSRRHREGLNWLQFRARILQRFPLPAPRIVHQYTHGANH